MSKSPIVYLSQMMDMVDEVIGATRPRLDPAFISKCRNFYPDRVPLDHYVYKDGTNVIRIAAAGLDRDDIEVSIVGDTICIQGNAKSSPDTEEAYSVLQHSLITWIDPFKIRLDDSMDINKVNFSLKKGILIVTIPPKEKKEPEVKKVVITD